MSDLSELPELTALVPRINGDVYEYQSSYWIGKEHAAAVGHKGAIVRIGFRLYEIIGYDALQAAYELRPFRANLSEGALMYLSGQAHKPSG